MQQPPGIKHIFSIVSKSVYTNFSWIFILPLHVSPKKVFVDKKCKIQESIKVYTFIKTVSMTIWLGKTFFKESLYLKKILIF